jgi:hypothetical protein
MKFWVVGSSTGSANDAEMAVANPNRPTVAFLMKKFAIFIRYPRSIKTAANVLQVSKGLGIKQCSICEARIIQ